MRRQGFHTAVTVGFLILGVLRPAPAQETTRMAPGDRVRVVRCEAVVCRSPARVDGLVLAATTDALTVQTDTTTLRIPWASVHRVERYEGRHGAVRSFALVFGGLVLGSVLGVTTGLLVQGDCYEAGCIAGPAYGFLVGAPVGLMAGVTVAVLTHDRWRTVVDGRVRVSVGPAGVPSRPGMGAGVVIPFRW